MWLLIHTTPPPQTRIFFVPSFKQVPRTAFMRGLKSKHAAKQVRTKRINDLHILQHELHIAVRQQILILKIAGGDPSLSVWQSSGIRIIHMAGLLLMTIYGLVLASRNLQLFIAPSEKCIYGQRRSTLIRNIVISMFGISTFRDHVF
jgi:hypothetical protein